jgi:hypothetical protein
MRLPRDCVPISSRPTGLVYKPHFQALFNPTRQTKRVQAQVGPLPENLSLKDLAVKTG